MRPHPLKWPTIRAARRVRSAAKIAVQPVRLYWVHALALSAAFTLGWLAFALPLQGFEDKHWEVSHQLRERIADLRSVAVFAEAR